MKHQYEFQQLLDKLSTYTYGILYNDDVFVSDKEEIEKRDGTTIIVQSPKMMDDHKAGMCHDASIYVDKELTRLSIPHKCAYVFSYKEPMCPTHSFVLAFDEDTRNWIIIDVFASKNCIWGSNSYKGWNEALDARIASWIKSDNENSANILIHVMDHMPEVSENGSAFCEDFDERVVENGIEYEFNLGYSHVEYKGVGIYQALKKAVGWDWKDIINSKEIGWLPSPPEYNGSYKSYFTMKGYRLYQKFVMPILKEHLNVKLISEEYVDRISDEAIVYSDEFQAIVKRRFGKFNELYEKTMGEKL